MLQIVQNVSFKEFCQRKPTGRLDGVDLFASGIVKGVAFFRRKPQLAKESMVLLVEKNPKCLQLPSQVERLLLYPLQGVQIQIETTNPNHQLRVA